MNERASEIRENNDKSPVLQERTDKEKSEHSLE